MGDWANSCNNLDGQNMINLIGPYFIHIFYQLQGTVQTMLDGHNITC